MITFKSSIVDILEISPGSESTKAMRSGWYPESMGALGFQAEFSELKYAFINHTDLHDGYE